MRRSVKRSLSAAILGAFLAACSALGDNPATLFADPSKYQYSDCEQLATQRKIWSTREQELKLLMDRAAQGGRAIRLHQKWVGERRKSDQTSSDGRHWTLLRDMDFLSKSRWSDVTNRWPQSSHNQQWRT